MKRFTPEEEKFIREAAQHLEFPSFLVRVTDLLGKPLEKGINALPAQAKALIEKTSQRAIEGALQAALKTIPPTGPARDFAGALRQTEKVANLHLAGGALTGAVGGFFGLPALVAELPITTTIMLRGIADTAAAFGEDLSRSDVRMECLSVFSLGGPSSADNEMESAYYTTRVGLAKLIESSVTFVASHTAHEILRAVERKSAPALVELLVRIASRFELVVSEKALGQLIPGIGAGAGALLNVAFGEHFQSVARYHFGLRRLEREKGRDPVEAEYREARLALYKAKSK